MRKIVSIGILALLLLLLLAVGISSAREAPLPLSPSQQQCEDLYEPNDSFGEAIPIAPGLIKSYICCEWSDMDYFTFTVDAGDLIYVNLYNLPADYNLCLFDPKQQMIKCSNNSGTAIEIIKETAADSGYHYAQVYGSQGACDSEKPYSLDLQVIPQPPTITAGPTATQVLSTSATITWTTNKNSDSLVKFGQYAGAYKAKESDPTLSQDHEIVLSGLEPATVYHYLVESTDGSSNTVASGERFFETAPPDLPSPTIYSPTVARADVDRELYKIAVPVSETQSVERVEFYLNGRLIGIDYSADPLPKSHLSIAVTEIVTQNYSAWLDPAKLKMEWANFFGKQHTILAKVFGLKGLLLAEQTIVYMPPFEPPDIDLTMWPRYHPTLLVDAAGSTLPAGTTIDVSVRASEDEWSCTWVHLAGETRCGDVAHAVDRVVFEVDGTPVYTSYPDDDGDFYHDYVWDVSGLGVGTYQIAATAHGSEGQLRTLRTLTVEPGEPSLEVSRSVSQLDHCFRVDLTVENNGTGSFFMDSIVDNVTGFQPVMKQGSNYSVNIDCQSSLENCDVNIDFLTLDGSEVITLAPGVSETVSYLAMPILYPEEFDYGIGEDEVRILDESGESESLLRPGDRTEDGLLLPEAIAQARRECDYLIVSRPNRFFFFDSDEEVNALLSTLGRLAEAKAGILGYLPSEGFREGPPVSDAIRAWGSDMMGSDGEPEGYMSNGYLLIVGEMEIMPAYIFSDSDIADATSSWGGGGSVDFVTMVDNGYADVSGNLRPELIVGRLIGDSAAQLRAQVETSLSNPFWRDGASDALVASGIGDGLDSFESNADRVTDLLDDEFTVSQMYGSDYDTDADRLAEFRTRAPDKDILFYRDHGGPNCWSHTVCEWDFPVDFGESHPFAFGSACSTGDYEDGDDISIAEAFLDEGAGVYIGAVERSARSANNTAGRTFFDRWVDHTKSLGQAFKETKRDLGISNDYKRLWVLEYNLYGDPKYGDWYLPPAASLAVSSLAPQALSSLEITVPQYGISTSGGLDYVDIPGPGGQVLLAPDEFRVPIYVTSTTYAEGYEVQDVELTARSGLTATTGLTLPTVSMAPNGDDERQTEATGATSTGWYPEDEYDWEVTENPDGSSTLFLTIYPFYYHADTGDAKFYRNYSFDIELASSSVAIDELTTEEAAYAQGDEVLIDLLLENSGEAQDVIVDAQVQTLAGEMVEGLLLRSLKGLTGTASFSPRWDSTGFDPGYYRVEAEVRDGAGEVLDRKAMQFRLGIFSGEVTALTAMPSYFDIGETISTSLTFSNTGDVAINGTARIEIRDGSSELVETFTHTVTSLAPSDALTFDDQWDTSGAEEGTYGVIGYVLYDAKATEIETVTVSTETYVYLPLVLRGGQ